MNNKLQQQTSTQNATGHRLVVTEKGSIFWSDLMLWPLKLIQIPWTALQLQFWSLKIRWSHVFAGLPAVCPRAPPKSWKSNGNRCLPPGPPRCRLQRQQRSPDGHVATRRAQCLPLAGHDPSWVAADPRARWVLGVGEVLAPVRPTAW